MSAQHSQSPGRCYLLLTAANRTRLRGRWVSNLATRGHRRSRRRGINSSDADAYVHICPQARARGTAYLGVPSRELVEADATLAGDVLTVVISCQTRYKASQLPPMPGCVGAGVSMPLPGVVVVVGAGAGGVVVVGGEVGV